MGWKTFGWSLALFVPILSWYAIVHLPTLWYKHGTRTSAGRGKAPLVFTSLPAFAGAVTLFWVIAISALIVASVPTDGNTSAQSNAPRATVRLLPLTPSGPFLTGAEAAGKAEAQFRRWLQETDANVQGLSYSCDYEDFNSRTEQWVVDCFFVGSGNSLNLRITVDDRTGAVNIIE